MKKTLLSTLFTFFVATTPVQAQYQNYADIPSQTGSGGYWYTDSQGYPQYVGGGPGRLGCNGGSWWPNEFILTYVTFYTPYGSWTDYTWGQDWTWLELGMVDVPEGDWGWDCVTWSYIWDYNRNGWSSIGNAYSNRRTSTVEGSVPYQRGLFTSELGYCGDNYHGYWPYYRQGDCGIPGGCPGLPETLRRCNGDDEWVTIDYKRTGFGHPFTGVTLMCPVQRERPGVRECRAPF